MKKTHIPANRKTGIWARLNRDRDILFWIPAAILRPKRGDKEVTGIIGPEMPSRLPDGTDTRLLGPNGKFRLTWSGGKALPKVKPGSPDPEGFNWPDS